jgi:hypothetical protein
MTEKKKKKNCSQAESERDFHRSEALRLLSIEDYAGSLESSLSAFLATWALKGPDSAEIVTDCLAIAKGYAHVERDAQGEEVRALLSFLYALTVYQSLSLYLSIYLSLSLLFSLSLSVCAYLFSCIISHHFLIKFSFIFIFN